MADTIEATKTTSDTKEQTTVVIGGGKAGKIGGLVGTLAGLYYANKKGSGVWGYIGYAILFGFGGQVGGAILDETILKK